MSDRPDIDEFAEKVQAGGWKITGGKYAPPSSTTNDIREIMRPLLYHCSGHRDVKEFETAQTQIKQLISDTLLEIIDGERGKVVHLFCVGDNFSTGYAHAQQDIRNKLMEKLK